MSGATRQERDSLGSVELPEEALWGVHTMRAMRNFGSSGVTLRELPALLDALMSVKIAASLANQECGVLARDVGGAIVRAAREVRAGQWHDQFPVNVVQGGGGTATNMNVNEVLANRAGELLGGRRGDYATVHPNDHVNRSQSTNDVYPTAVQVAVMTAGAAALADFERLAEAFLARARAYEGVERLARTCLQDALPIGIDATHRSHAHAIRRASRGIAGALLGLRGVPLGGTAVGTGAGAPLGYRERAVARLGEETGLELAPAEDPHDAMAHLDPLLAVAAALARMMLLLGQIAQDLRLLSSGPVGGIGEVILPAVQVGSSMMPGKVNPVIPELVLQIGFEVRGAHHAIEAAVAAGELELNIMEPVVAKQLLTAIADSGRAARRFAEGCVEGLTWNLDVVRDHLRGSLQAAVERALDLGWEAAGRPDEHGGDGCR